MTDLRRRLTAIERHELAFPGLEARDLNHLIQLIDVRLVIAWSDYLRFIESLRAGDGDGLVAQRRKERANRLISTCARDLDVLEVKLATLFV